MKIWVIFLKTWREMRRDAWMLGLTLAFSPLFVLIYWVFTQGGSTSYTVLVVNHDQGASTGNSQVWYAGEEAIRMIEAVRYADGKPLLRVKLIENKEHAHPVLRDRAAVAFLVIPPDFSKTLMALKTGEGSDSVTIDFGGDLTNPYYMVGATLAISAVDNYIIQATGQQALVHYAEEALGASAARTEFEAYTPGILIFAVIMLIFLAAMVIAREIETGALRRLQITPMSSFDFLGGVTLAMVTLGTISVLLTFLTALALGFRSQGPIWAAVLVGSLTSLSIIGVGMIVACFARSVSQAFVIANFPLGLFMFFSGAIFPVTKIVIFQFAGHEIGLYDILPPTYAVVALNKILTLGAGLGDVAFELGALTVLSMFYFAVGVWLFQRLRL